MKATSHKHGRLHIHPRGQKAGGLLPRKGKPRVGSSRHGRR
jgi:hypothetical protein